MQGDSCIVDTRPLECFLRQHCEGAYHLPLAMLRSLSCALPPRQVHLQIVCATDEDCKEAMSTIARMGFERATAVPWEVVVGTSEVPLIESAPDKSVHPWAPNELLLSVVDELERWLGGPGVLLDVGSGTCRDLVFLALRGWHTVGFDNRVKLLRQAHLLAQHHAQTIDVMEYNLRRCYPCRSAVVDVVLVSRFLYRPLLTETFVLPRIGGFVVYNHFLHGCQHTAVGTPSTVDGYLLVNELLDICKQLGNYEVLQNNVALLADGRPMCHFVARRVS